MSAGGPARAILRQAAAGVHQGAASRLRTATPGLQHFGADGLCSPEDVSGILPTRRMLHGYCGTRSCSERGDAPICSNECISSLDRCFHNLLSWLRWSGPAQPGKQASHTAEQGHKACIICADERHVLRRKVAGMDAKLDQRRGNAAKLHATVAYFSSLIRGCNM